MDNIYMQPANMTGTPRSLNHSYYVHFIMIAEFNTENLIFVVEEKKVLTCRDFNPENTVVVESQAQMGDLVGNSISDCLLSSWPLEVFIVRNTKLIVSVGSSCAAAWKRV